MLCLFLRHVRTDTISTLFTIIICIKEPVTLDVCATLLKILFSFKFLFGMILLQRKFKAL
jgi:hypothetical protein